jgi:two-component system, response regulator / RNA-binding antiterminator
MTGKPQVNLRGRRALIVHPADTEAQELGLQLSRIGLSVQCTWPCPERLGQSEDFVFVALTEDIDIGPILAGLGAGKRAVRVVLVESESPTVLEKIIKLDADAVIVKPFRPVGLLANLVHALHKRRLEEALVDRAATLERKLGGFRAVEKAKEILMARHALSGEDAFAWLRRHAMNERTSVEQVAHTIVEADRFLQTKAS